MVRENFLTALTGVKKDNGYNELIRAWSKKQLVEYQYGADGLRRGKKVDGRNRYHVWDGANMVLEIGVNGVTAARYLRGLELIAREQDGKREYYHQNGHGDIILRMDAWGNALKAYEYDAFGVEQEREKLDTNPFRYCGEYWDEETETIYLRARNYRPAVGSFWSEDPIRDGLHWYAYCAGNPVSFVDPSGMEATQDQGWLEKTLNGIRDVLDYLTLGTISASEARSQAMLNDPSFYTIGNWLTLGLFDTVKGTFAPEEPLSLQHWMDSLGTATLVMGIWESVSRLPKRTKTQTDAQNKSSSVTQGMTESGSGVLDNANYFLQRHNAK